MKKAILFSIVNLIFLATFAQEYITISGKVTDKETNEVCPYASIGLKSVLIGTITNDQGDFVFHIPAEYKNDTFFVSVLGYESYKSVVSQTPEKIDVKLKAVTFELSEVSVTGLDAYEIVKNAFDNMGNYAPSEPYILGAYYHEYVQEDTTFVRAIETATNIYTTNDHNFQIQVEGVKLSNDLIKNNEDVYNSAFWLFELDFHIFKTLFEPDKKNKEQYKIGDIYFTENDKVYIITYNDDAVSLTYHISYKNNAIFKFQWIQKTMAEFDKGKTYIDNVNFNAEYLWFNDKLYPKYKYVNFTESKYNSKNRKDLISDRTFFAEYTMNNIITEKVEAFEENSFIMQPNDLYEQSFKYDSVFWENYNYKVEGSLKGKLGKNVENLDNN